MKEPSEDSILGSHYTSVSLCGGGGIISAHNRQKGLPVGVYVDNGIINELSPDQKKMAVPVKKDKELYLIKNDIDIMNLLPDNTLELLCNNPKASKKAIIQSLEVSNYDEDAIRKFMPWMLVHMRKYKYV